MDQILALYLDFEGVKNIHVLYVLIWGFARRWRFLTGVWLLDLSIYSLVFYTLMFHVLDDAKNI